MPKKSEALISGVLPGSIAEELGIKAGDIVLSINGKIPSDLIDYQFLCADEYVNLEILKPCGERWQVEIEKEYEEDLGISFEDAVFGKIRRCCNKCLFCFVDQMPEGLRKSLYVKDDDYRLSFLFGNYITLTNLRKEDIKRITRWHLSPLYVSVHTTNDRLRSKLLGNASAKNILNILKRLSEAGIELHLQAVLCPGINDGRELERTINDVFSLWPAVQTLAVVPVGLTSYREGLFKLEGYKRATAQKVLDLIKDYQEFYYKQAGSRFVFAADEFYLLAGYEIPSPETYEGFPQLENGIGMISFFRKELADIIKRSSRVNNGKKVGIITGTLAAPFLEEVLSVIKRKIGGFNARVLPLQNNFFGPSVTVAGLLTASDLIKQLPAYLKNEAYGELLLPGSALNQEGLFLDGLSLQEVSDKLCVSIKPVPPEARGLVRSLTA